MSLTERLEKTLSEREKDLLRDPSFVQLQEFYREMQRQGIATRRSYELPQVDTIGKTTTVTTRSQFSPVV